MNRPDVANKLAITFFYYRDLPAAMHFHEDVLCLSLAIDQSWCKIYELCPGAHVGLVGESRGMNKWAKTKPVQLCITIPNVSDWYEYAQEKGLENLSQLFINDEIGIRAFVFTDTEGYQIELQSATRPGA